MKYAEATIEAVDMLTPLADQIARFWRILADSGIDDELAAGLTRMVVTAYLEAWSKPLPIIHASNESVLKALGR